MFLFYGACMALNNVEWVVGQIILLLSTRAVATCDVVCWTIKRSVLMKMEVRHPQLCMFLQNALLKSLALVSTWATLALHPTLACNVESNTTSMVQR